MKKLIYLLTLIQFCSCHTEQTIPVEIDVALHIKDDNHTSPLSVTIENKTKSASSFQWTFQGGEPATSTKKAPERSYLLLPANIPLPSKPGMMVIVHQKHIL